LNRQVTTLPGNQKILKGIVVLAEKMISETVPVIQPSDTGQRALNCMDVLRVSHLPVVRGKEYQGLISDKYIDDFNLTDVPLDSQNLQLPAPHVHLKQHIYEAATVIYKLNLSLLPVLDDEHNYFGSITLSDFSRQLCRILSVEEPGGVIILQTTRNNYSVSQISQIIEGNDAKILNLFVTRIEDTDNLEVTIKLDQVDISAVLQTFTRYDYQISAVYMDDSMLSSMYEDRLELLLRYMNL